MRLIDANVIEKFLDDFADSCGNHQKAVLREVKYALGHLPTIDAVPTEFHDKCQQIEIQKRFKLEEELKEAEPIRHGKWIKNDEYSDDIERHTVYECSECGALCYWFDVLEHNYCRHCGAKMDKSEVEE